MTNSCENLRHPVDAPTASLLTRLAVTATEQGIDLLLVGAFAREVLFYHMYGIETGISTMDTDISVRVLDWDSFHRLRSALQHAGFQIAETPVEKIRDTVSGKEVDLIPFGPVAGADARLEWPDQGPTWNVLGFEEALSNAKLLSIQADGREPVSIPVVTIAALAMLKIVSFFDRPKERVRDARDIGFMITHYLDAGNRERLLAQPDLVARAAREPNVAAAYLLGQDIGIMASEKTHRYLVERLRHETTSSSECPLASTLARNSCQGKFHIARALLQSMIDGLETCY
ncbi:MAG TPA: nucleotidyl transferase AbiEii/AbiGii toxin family protein [Kiritimatiellia bacterium]|nr:nucleotidyl transferase AbiEii/AbiGii toxin family protein [Kiritimatiellia bacterium]